jgi:hypothetical protein
MMLRSRRNILSCFEWSRLLLGCAIVLSLCAPISAASESPARVASENDTVLSLAGEWRFAVGKPEPQFTESQPLPDVIFDDRIELPGTTETRGKGALNPSVELGQLTRVRKFDGPAWYEKSFEVPAHWVGKRLVLHLERTKYTQVWFDGEFRGSQRWATVPQRHVLTEKATAGVHRIVVMVDNRSQRRPYEAESHQYSDNTQTNWNGILGQIEVRAEDLFAVDDVQLFADGQAGTLRIELRVRNSLSQPIPARVEVTTRSWNHEGPVHEQPLSGSDYVVPPGTSALGYAHVVGQDFRTWDEFSPALYRTTIRVMAAGVSIERSFDVGFRQLQANGPQLRVNGRATFLRGKHDACVFPITGHPPMEVEGWLEYFGKLRRYGINHVRCHTWVPPRAAFIAADRLGIYLQPELPFWGAFDLKIRDALMPEAERVLREYGNHPSFVMFTLGNELSGDRKLMNDMVERLKTLDPRRLYADGCNNYLWDPEFQPTNDFWVTAKAKTPASGGKAVPARGSYYQGDGFDGHVQWGPSSTRPDLRLANSGIPAPVIGHEIGQYTVYPNFRDIPKYTGVVEARNLHHFRESLRRRGLLGQADEWFRASGALAASLYKEDVELALRTPGFGGFQLLDLQDFPGQGTALVGILDAFLDSKGLITEEEWRQFCSEVVPLARFDRYTWTTADVYRADLQVAHYGAATLPNASATWRLADAAGQVLAAGEAFRGVIERGALRDLGRAEIPLNQVPAPGRYELEVTVAADARRFTNRWPLWVYPAEVRNEIPPGVHVARDWASAQRSLREGKSVLLMPAGKDFGYSVSGAYATDFWCWPMFGSSPGTMGLLVSHKHPALKAFPTRSHSERQWANIALASRPLILSETPADVVPVVQVIDNLARNEKLGLLFEARVGSGKLLVCAVDLISLQEHPEARQLLASLVSYMESVEFVPRTELPEGMLNDILRDSIAKGAAVTASSHHQPSWGSVPKPEAAVDGDINTRWTAKDGDATPWIAVDLGKAVHADTVQLLWDSDEPGYRYWVEHSGDGKTWKVLSDQRDNQFAGGRHTLKLSPTPTRHIRVTVAGAPAGKKASLCDLRILAAEPSP